MKKRKEKEPNFEIENELIINRNIKPKSDEKIKWKTRKLKQLLYNKENGPVPEI